jgi:hypothetical protein
MADGGHCDVVVQRDGLQDRDDLVVAVGAARPYAEVQVDLGRSANSDGR